MPDEAMVCGFCGKPFATAAAVPAPAEAPSPAEPEPAPEEAKPKKKRRLMIGLIAGAVALLAVAAVLLVLLLPRGSGSDMLKKVTFGNWTEKNGEKTDEYVTVIKFNDKGLPAAAEYTADGKTHNMEIEYETDEHGNPVTCSIPAIDDLSPARKLAFGNSYEDGKLTRAEITEAEGTFGSMIYDVMDWLTYYPGYGNAEINYYKDEVMMIQYQLRDGLVVRAYFSDPFSQQEQITEYEGRVRIRTTMTYIYESETDNQVTVVTDYDRNGFVVKEAVTQKGETKTYAYMYEDAEDEEGKACRVMKMDAEHSENVSESDFRSFTEGYRAYRYGSGRISMAVSQSDSYERITRYDQQGRTTASETRNDNSDSVYRRVYTYEYR